MQAVNLRDLENRVYTQIGVRVYAPAGCRIDRQFCGIAQDGRAAGKPVDIALDGRRSADVAPAIARIDGERIEVERFEVGVFVTKRGILAVVRAGCVYSAVPSVV